MKRSRLLALCLLAVPAAGAQEYEVTTESLYREMTDLSRLARFPEPAYTTRQFSSYDRRSTDPESLTDDNWFANGDRGKHLREEMRNGKTEYVLMDTDGPGALVRFWSADPENAGRMSVYLDGSDEPIFDIPLAAYLGGEVDFALDPIGGQRARGWNSYMPIPFAKHCKITTNQRDFYYIIDYRRYADGTRVESFNKESALPLGRLIRGIEHSLRTPSGVVTPGSEKTRQQSINANVAPKGGTRDVGTFEGPGAIYALAGRLESKEPEAALRGCLLEVTFDDAETPQILAPLSDFFGSGLGLNPYESLPSGVSGGEIVYSKWVMPYEKSVQFRLINHSDYGVIANFTILIAPWEWDDRSMHFHAKWRGETRVPTRPRSDWNILNAAGQGRYVGTVLHITNPSLSWWGEGDEKIYVDGETFPSWFGTGTEDYFGYAWGNTTLFTHAYHAQARVDGPQNFGNTVNSRFHIMDDIPFNSSIRFDMEVWHWKDCAIAQSTTAYWYARPGGTDGFEVPGAEDLRVPEVEEPELKRVKGALEGENFRVIDVTGGRTEAQYSDSWGWSAFQHRWWLDAVPGDKLTLAFPVAEAGRYEVKAVFTSARDYGMVQHYINGEAAGEVIDFYNKEVEPTQEISLGVFELKEGENEFAAKITGANEAAIARHMFGLDYLRLVPVNE